MRPFHTLTEFFRNPLTSDYDWVEDFRKRRDRELAAYRDELDNELPHLAAVPDLAEDDFVYLCRKAHYVAFYVGQTAGEPPPIAPRYESLEGLRILGDPVAAGERIRRSQRLVVTALHRTKLALDRDHNFLSRKSPGQVHLLRGLRGPREGQVARPQARKRTTLDRRRESPGHRQGACSIAMCDSNR